MHGPTSKPGTHAPDASASAPAASALLGSLGSAPPLAMWAMASAVVSLACNRVAIRSLGTDTSHEVLITLDRWFALARNLSAIAGVVALTAAVYDFLRHREAAPLSARMLVAALAGIFLPATVFATFVPVSPAPRVQVLILLGIGAGSLLVIAITLAVARWQGPLGLRTSLVLFAASVFFSLGALVIHALLPISMWETSVRLSRVLRSLGEVTYLLAPLAAVPSVRPMYPPKRARIGRTVGAATGLAVIAVMAWGRHALGDDFSTILYGATRLELLLDSAPLLYALPLAVGFGIGAAALTSGSAADRQAGAGILLLMAAGYAPKAPAQLMMMVLGMALLGRTLIAQATAIRETRVGTEA